MINSQDSYCRTIIRPALLVLSVLALSSCGFVAGLFPPKHQAAHAKPYKKTYDASTFIDELAKGKLALEHDGTLADISDTVEILDHYTAQKHTKPAHMILAVLEYTSAKGKQKIIAPLPDKGQDFSALSEITAQLDKFPHTFSDVVVFKATVMPQPPLNLAGKDQTSVLEALQARQQDILASTSKLSGLDDAREQLALLSFFMDHHQKEGAYLCADNAKRVLASAARNSADIQADNQLTQVLNALEGRLRQEMPY